MSLTLRALLKTAASRAGLGTAVPDVTSFAGLTPAAQAFAVAVVAGDAPAIVVVPTDGDVERMTADARFFFAALEGMGDAEVVRAVLPFPSQEIDPYRELPPHLDVASARARALTALARGTARIVIASAPALLPRLSSPDRLLRATVDLVVGGSLLPTDLADRLADAGFTREDPVDARGEFCVRGGVVDVFPAGEPHPIRAEFAGDAIESLRRFDAATQRSVTKLDQITVVPLRDLFELTSDDGATVDRTSSVFDYVERVPARVLVSEPVDTLERLEQVAEQVRASHDEALVRGETALPPEALQVDIGSVRRWLGRATTLEALSIEAAGVAHATTTVRHVPCQPTVEFHGRLGNWVSEVRRGRNRGEAQLFVAATTGRVERIVDLLTEEGLTAVSVDGAEDTHAAALFVATGHLSRGFRLPAAALQVYAEADLFDEEHQVRQRRRSTARAFLSDFRDLKVGDQVVHADHGVGTFVGLTQLAVDHEPHELMELRYEGGDKLFVPVEHLDLIQKYTGATRPTLDRLGGTTWERAKTRVRRSMRDMAEELLKLYAARKALPGHAFSSDTHWQQEFEDAFEYELTPDQRTAIADIKRDLEAPTPMDRLLCGDVGYGKTEVALHAAFKVVMDGKQVALLAPTTVLTFQHYKTLRERYAAFPVRIEMVNRFRSKAEQKAILADLAVGKVDVVVGTHRLLSKDVAFRDFGLLIVDEEQRFGVAHKERIKQLRRRVDVLTLTATPIPRTLNMSLAGIRDMSVIETPPKDRLSIQTNVLRFDQQVIARAIRTELARGGQVYVVHNRIQSIHGVAELLLRLVPEARLAVAHGQMNETDLERVMVDFVAHKYDILVATTIIENGLDIPNVNTIVINHAERYGLADLYQLRGRVGRSARRAYAYLVVPADNVLSQVARQRLAAIKEFSELGSGFRVAALDLEIRGAGNLLGAEQSGHIEAVGFDTYVKLLEQTVRELQGENIEDERRAVINLGVDLRVDDKYIADTNQRLAVYRKVAAATDEAQLATVLEEVTDRYGPLDPSILRLVEYGRVRVLADCLGVESINREGRRLAIKFRTDAPLDPRRLVEFVQARPAVKLVPPGVIQVDLRAGDEVGDISSPGREWRPGGEPTSWWTKRAPTGFTKARTHWAGRPRAGVELFSRVSGLLSELSGGE